MVLAPSALHKAQIDDGPSSNTQPHSRPPADTPFAQKLGNQNLSFSAMRESARVVQSHALMERGFQVNRGSPKRVVEVKSPLLKSQKS